MNTIDVSSLEFQDVFGSLQSYLSTDPVFADYNFAGSNISALLNLLAFNTTFQGMYIKMLMDESFIDTAQTLPALLSHAKKSGYLPKGVRSARTNVTVTVNTGSALPPYIIIPQFSTFTSTSTTSSKVSFSNIDPITIKRNGANTYVSDSFEIYDGNLITANFLVDNTIPNQKFVIQDTNCDKDTISVRVLPNITSTSYTEYLLQDPLIPVGSSSQIYIISATVDGNFEIYFGNGIFGKAPDHNSVVQVRYLSSKGLAANSIGAFKINLSNSSGVTSTDINAYTATVVTESVSSGGLGAETVADLQFSIPNHNKRAGRVVTASDVSSIILSEYRDIDSLSVWGGEKNTKIQYGTIFISAKPKFSDVLTQSAKNEISTNLISKYGMVGADIVFVDPDFTNILLSTYVTVDRTKTSESNGSIQARMQTKITNYNDNVLSKFDINYYDSNLITTLLYGETAIFSVQNQKTIQKVLTFSHGTGSLYTINFGNSIKGIITEIFNYGLNSVYCKNVNSDLFFYNSSDDSLLSSVSFGTVDLSSGIVKINIPVDIKSSNMIFNASPIFADIYTSNDNIVRITSAVVNIQ